jgi:hypothetical protein
MRQRDKARAAAQVARLDALARLRGVVEGERVDALLPLGRNGGLN